MGRRTPSSNFPLGTGQSRQCTPLGDLAHVAVTDHPTAAWTAQQLRNAFSENDAPKYLLHDRDSIFADVATTIAGMNTAAVRTAPRSPWQNAYVERVIGSMRRECLDHALAASGE